MSPLPDLTIASMSAPSTVGRGIFYPISVTVRRTGGNLTSSLPARVRIYLSTNTSLESWDYRASLDYSGSLFSASSLNAYGSVTQSVECAPDDVSLVPPRVPVGTYYWIAVVDDLYSHSESSEGNNIYVGGLVTVL